jgi:hypothetical protein
MTMIERRQPEVTYEFFDQPDIERRVRHACEILASADVACLTKKIVVPSDEIGESDRPTNIHIHTNTPTPSSDPSRHHSTYERR